MIRVLVIAIALCACKKSADPAVARLDEMTAKVERMPRENVPWQPARVGDRFVIGSAVRTGPASHAKLTVGKRGKLDVDASSVVYFTRTPGQERSDVRVETGIAELETGDEPVGIGKAVLEPRTRVRIEARPEGTSLVVTVGRAMLDDTVIAAGEKLTLGPAGLPVEQAPPDAGAAAATETPLEATPPPAKGDEPLGEVPARTAATIKAGESPTIHDPRAPAPLRIAFDCAAGGVVEVAKDRAFKKLVARSGGTTGANVLVPAGAFQYRVRCAGSRGPSGTVRVATDSGKRPLPKTAARTAVDMDGREYTILYQNLLPQLTLTWKTAPRAAKYTFVIKSRAGEKRVESPRASLALEAGELREGSYKIYVEPLLVRRSEETTVTIEFDNAAQSASIDSVEASDGKIRVKGTVIESSTVSANDAPVSLDRHRRFDAELTPRDGEDGIGVRIAHPKAGVHYYVMRIGPS
jgi:hypothetical protein